MSNCEPIDIYLDKAQDNALRMQKYSRPIGFGVIAALASAAAMATTGVVPSPTVVAMALLLVGFAGLVAAQIHSRRFEALKGTTAWCRAVHSGTLRNIRAYYAQGFWVGASISVVALCGSYLPWSSLAALLWASAVSGAIATSLTMTARNHRLHRRIQKRHTEDKA